MSFADLTLPPELDAFVRTKVAEGEYQTPNEMVCTALMFLRERDRSREMRLQELRKEVQIGLDELDRGLGVPLDMNEIREEVKRRLAHPQESK
jgi:antitoxin ParD1/3/4